MPDFCLHELGRTLQAKKFLMKGPVALTSFRMDPSFRAIAKKDPDLESVRELI
jgi:hypothetical protein